MTVLITFTTIGADAGPFNLFSDVNGFCCAFETGVTTAQLLAGFPSSNVPAGTNYIKAKSAGVCTNEVTLFITGGTTSTTSTSTTLSCSTYDYTVEGRTCACSLQGVGQIFNDTQLTVGKWYYLDFPINAKIRILSFNGCTLSSPSAFILDSSQEDNCVDVICSTTTTSTTV